MDRKELKLELERLADRFSEGWHKGIKIDASDIMLLTEAAQALDQPAQPAQPAQPEQEPVGDDFFRMIADRNPKPFSTPQRTWVGLTDEEFDELDKEDLSLREFVQAIDDRLKQKNGYTEEKNT